MSSRNSESRISNDSSNTMPSPVIFSIVIICYHLMVLGYLITLEDNNCHCLRDWRHDFLKYYSIAMIFITLIMLVLTGNIKNKNLSGKLNWLGLLQITIMVAFLINVWCLYTYIGDLDATNCQCAIQQQKDIHYFLYIWRYILVASIVISLLLILMSAVFGK